MKRLICICLFFAVAFPLLSQTIKIEAPNVVAVGEQFNLTFAIEGEKAPTDFNWETPSDFKRVWGPAKGSSSQVSNINGKITKTSTFSYTYVLIANSAGTFTLPAATATINGKTVTSSTKSIQVVSGERKSKPNAGNTSGGGQIGAISSEDIYMRLLLSKNSAVVGEGITATLKLYQRVNIAGFEDFRFPSFSGFWTKELQSPSNIEFERETVGEEIFNTAVLRQWSISPQKAGELSIDPAELVCLVNVRQASSGSRSIFDSFFQDDYRTIRKRITTQPVTLRVKALPEGAPASFAGGVGKFTMKASLSADSLKTHDAASLKITVSGTGNIALLEAPKLSFPPDFEVYDVTTTDSPKGKTFEFPFIPRSHGEFTIGPVEYSYYDVAAGRYVTLRSAPLPLFVERGNSPEVQSPSQSGQLVVAQKDVKNLGSDIRYISTRVPSFVAEGSFFVWSGLYWGLLALLSLIAVAVYFATRKVAAMKADVAGTRYRAAVKMAKKRLALAGGFLQKNLYSGFYEELHRALLGFVGDKFGMDAGDLSRENIALRLVGAGASEGLADDFCKLLEDCEYARYSPDSGHSAMNEHYQMAVSVISKIDSCVHKKSDMKVLATLLVLLFAPFAAASAAEGSDLAASASGVTSQQGRNLEYADSLWNAGTAAYSEGSYNAALTAWQELYSAGFTSAELYTNIADAYYKTGDLARAILYYERALKLNPSFSDARYNLELVRTNLRDRLDTVPEFFLVSGLRSLSWKLSSNVWAGLSLLLFAVFLALLLLYLLGRNPSQRKAGFFSSIVALLLFATCLGFAALQKADYTKADDAIVTSPVVAVKSAPGAGDSKDLFILHEGTKLKIIDSVGEWFNVELSDGRQGWVEAKNMEIV